MCDHGADPGGREAAMVVLDPGTPEHLGRDGIWCDPCLVPLVKALNDGGLPTTASCCGHGNGLGRISLRDGRELFLVPDFAAANALVDAVAPAEPPARQEPAQPASGGQRAATPVRPYPSDAPLVAVHESEWEDAQHALSQVPELEDALANAEAHVKRLDQRLAQQRARIADFLLTYGADGDTSDPEGWQAGHNYAMREAARMVREGWTDLGSALTERTAEATP